MALATGFRVVIQQRAALEVEPAVLWREERRVLKCRSADVPIGESGKNIIRAHWGDTHLRWPKTTTSAHPRRKHHRSWPAPCTQGRGGLWLACRTNIWAPSIFRFPNSCISRARAHEGQFAARGCHPRSWTSGRTRRSGMSWSTSARSTRPSARAGGCLAVVSHLTLPPRKTRCICSW